MIQIKASRPGHGANATRELGFGAKRAGGGIIGAGVACGSRLAATASLALLPFRIGAEAPDCLVDLTRSQPLAA